MRKEFMKIGPITCSIQSDLSYNKIRNEETDFTLAKEKPKLIPQANCLALETGGMSCEAAISNSAIRMNKIGAEILTMCNGKKTIAQISSELAEKYDYDDEEFVEQVKTFLNIFKTYKLIS